MREPTNHGVPEATLTGGGAGGGGGGTVTSGRRVRTGRGRAGRGRSGRRGRGHQGRGRGRMAVAVLVPGCVGPAGVTEGSSGKRPAATLPPVALALAETVPRRS